MSVLMEMMDKEIGELEVRLDALRKARQALTEVSNNCNVSEATAIESWNPIITKKTKSAQLVMSFMMQFGQPQVHRDTLYRALVAKGAKLGGPKAKTEDKRIGNLKAALSQNPDLFNYNPDTGMVSLKRK